ncbi:MAG: ribonuclease H [Pseudomonadota bacterium]
MSATPSPTPRVLAFTDGGCRGNPGPGAWAFLLVDLASGAGLERAGGERMTTNNRMEFRAAIEALAALKRPSEVEIRTDSKLLVNTATKWMAGWKARGWKRKTGEVENLDLVEALDSLVAMHRVRFTWVPGHAGVAGNEHVDALTNRAMDAVQAGREGKIEARYQRSPVQA